MIRFGSVAGLAVVAVGSACLALEGSWAWWIPAVTVGALAALGVYDLAQRKHAVLRNYPVLGHMRYLAEDIRPELQQYFIERNFDGRPFDRDVRALIYERAKGTAAELSFGTERDIREIGYEYLIHSVAPIDSPPEPPRVRIGGPDCRQPYHIALMNVSSMSFGALSGNALRALNNGARRGGFAHDTGEGGLTPYHLGGADLVWEIGSGYFGTRTKDGSFDPGQFREKAAHDAVKCISIKLSQGAKPGLGGVLPAAKVTQEIADYRGVPVGEKCVSPAAHSAFGTPRELVHFIARLRELADGKPVGFKLCVGSRIDVLAICKAMIAENVTPDFIIVDGAEGGTAAAPLEYEDNVGLPLTDGLMTVHNALVGTGLRDVIRIGASGKIATGTDIVKRLIQGADYTNSARSMMMALGCIQAQRCHTNECPVGVATQDPRRARALDVADKSERVYRYQHATVAEAMRLMASLGVDDPALLSPHMLRKRITATEHRSYAELYTWLPSRALLDDAAPDWRCDWTAADPDSFAPAGLARHG
ncbi:FMN-binding glutamate synthase family protein [Mycobacterium parmense]|uniref:FMN-binding glutamate synthase family protein n=1 Tax=Mycobacterium parmense TaxID=185642 RepID=A0A7I7YNK6_9MYCO|nr:FMN-binding glutamate synthase family protein [Mycobacterium parmense]MCV7353257.1 FMN-binding glutamate synthase family protein [Mycobacterium parmense]ORW61560.1 glutamate synthase [Mycobacterium parmense]BBZ43269.1 FMN-binding glutamate synthase family protein [Mycobacterium parmense]